MTHWYSPVTGGFGLKSWGKKKRPADAIDISKDEHDALFPKGEPHREIQTGPDGRPRWKPRDVAAERAAAMREVKRNAAKRIDAIFPVTAQMNAIRAGQTTDPRFAIIDAIRTASNMIEAEITDYAAKGGDIASYPVIGNPLWPEFYQ